MVKVLLILILSPLLAAETQTLTKIEDNCCQPEATFLNFESSSDSMVFGTLAGPDF